MQAVWIVRSRQIARKLAFWLALIGYNPNDRSLTHRIYLVYAVVFMSGWLFAMLSLFAGTAADILRALEFSPINQAAAALSTLALLSLGLFQLWQASRISPIVFSENDAYLICQAPVPGSAVAQAWFLGSWLETAAPFWAGAVTLGFALVEYRLVHKIGPESIPAYVGAGLEALLVLALVQAGLMALIWAAGALRLQGDRQLHWQPRAVRLGIIAFSLSLIYTLVRHGLEGLRLPFWRVVLWPVNFPAQAAFGAVSLSKGMLVGLIWVGLGLLFLTWSGAGLSLSRAAQETTQKEKIKTARRFGQFEQARQAALTDRLGSGRPPSVLPARPGLWMLGWKDVLQSSRAFGLPDAWGWLSLFMVSLGVCLVSDPGALALALAIWSIMIGQRVTYRLQEDLACWSLLCQMPFSSRRLLLAELALPWVLVILSGWTALVLAGGAWSFSVRLTAGLLLVCLSAAISLAAAFDLLRQSKSELLLNGVTPQVSSVGGSLGVLCLAFTLGLWFWLGSGLLAIILAVLLALVFLQISSQRLQQMK